jgi:hypothetical protein
MTCNTSAVAGSPLDLAIFTEGNHFPALFGGEIIEPFRAWARDRAEYASLVLDNIVVVTLPQPMIVGMLLGHAISLGNLTLEVSQRSGFYPDIVMAGAAPLTRLCNAGIVQADARVFARNRGPSLLVASGDPHAIASLEDLTQSDIRVVLASESEPGARSQYIAALNALVGENATRSILAKETVRFPCPTRDPAPRCAARNRTTLRRCWDYFSSSSAILCGRLSAALCDGHGAGRRAVLVDHRDGRGGQSIAR